MKSRRIIVVGTLASNPYAGIAWDVLQVTVGLRRLGHEVYYFEVASDWPYDPIRRSKVNDSEYALPYLARVTESFGLGGCWAYRRSYADKAWFGLERRRAEALLASADAVLNYAGCTRLRTKEMLKVGRLVYYGTDPGYHEIAFANGDKATQRVVEQHDDFVTLGANIGTSACPIPPLPRFRGPTSRPVLLDIWQAGSPAKPEFTTVCNWKQEGRDITFAQTQYYWSKHREFLKFLDIPRRTKQPIELAMGLADSSEIHPGAGEVVAAVGMTHEERCQLHAHGWQLTDAHALSTDPWPYRDYIQASRAEFTVAKDMNVRLHTGWFSERSAYYLAAGRPVVTQDTGFGRVLPTGEGLFSFNTTEEAVEAIQRINSDYARHSRAARRIAEEYFCAETVLQKLIQDLGL